MKIIFWALVALTIAAFFALFAFWGLAIWFPENATKFGWTAAAATVFCCSTLIGSIATSGAVDK